MSTALEVGARFPEIRRTITQEHVDLYARASADKNPLHIDEEFARTTHFGRRIAHGQLTLSVSAQVVTAHHFAAMSRGGGLTAAFLGPVFPGDELVVNAEVVRLEDDAAGRVAVCEITTHVQDRQVLAATARVPLEQEDA